MVRRLSFLPFAILLAASITGCTVFSTKVAPNVAKAVNRYCLEPREERLLLRGQVNGMIVPNKIAVTCQGDPDSPQR